MLERKDKRINLRIEANVYDRILHVMDRIAQESPRGLKPELSEIIRSLCGWGNPNLLTDNERAYLAGSADALPSAKRDYGSGRARADIRPGDKVAVAPARRKRIRKYPR